MHNCFFQCLIFCDRNWAVKTKCNHFVSTYWAIVAWSSICRHLCVKAHVTISLWHWKKTIIDFVVFLLPALGVFLITMSLYLWITKWLISKYKVKFNPPWRYQLSPSEIIAIILRPQIPSLLETEPRETTFDPVVCYQSIREFPHTRADSISFVIETKNSQRRLSQTHCSNLAYMFLVYYPGHSRMVTEQNTVSRW